MLARSDDALLQPAPLSNATLRGGWLSGTMIKCAVVAGEITIDPFSAGQINPNSYNYSLGVRLKRVTSDVIDLRMPDEFEDIEISEDGTTLSPGECYLGHTAEIFGSEVYAALVTGRSSIGRKFITNHITAGLIDVGFLGEITLEITVQKPTVVYPGVLFGQIFWFSVVGETSPQYEGKYQRQTGPTGSRMFLDHGSR